MVDQETGTAQLKARHPLNCEERRTHVVSIVAVSCSGATSDRWAVHLYTRVTCRGGVTCRRGMILPIILPPSWEQCSNSLISSVHQDHNY